MIEGVKHDQDKPKLELLSSIWIEGVARVLTFGAKKYADHNWRKGLAQSRLVGAALRHIFAYLRGEDLDPETSLSHLDHASCCLMFARELSVTKPELDDRWKTIIPETSDPKKSSCVTTASLSVKTDPPPVIVNPAIIASLGKEAELTEDMIKVLPGKLEYRIHGQPVSKEEFDQFCKRGGVALAAPTRTEGGEA